MTPEQVLAEVVRDRSFYDRTGGGVTFSGGEPLTQPDFLVKLLQCCREAGIGTAIETCGCAPWESFAAVVPLVDVFLYDIKHLDSAHHRAYTGAGCEQIVANCRHLAKVAKRLIIRVPVIPQFNFDLESLRDIVRFAETLPVEEVDFLPYHRMAENKYRYLGRDYWAPGPERLTAEEVGALVGQIVTPLKCKIGG
jgi:pyruvate formate lyase activating enzyme